MSPPVLGALGGALFAAGIWAMLALRWARPSLAERLTDPAPSATDTAAVASRGWAARLGRLGVPVLAALGLPTDRTRTRLAACDRDTTDYLAEKTTAALLGLAAPPLLVTALAVAGAAPAPVWAMVMWGLFAVVAWLAPDLALRDRAAKRRAALRHTLAAFADLVVIALAGGAGVNGALEEAAQASPTWAMRRIRTALHAAALRRQPPWTALRELAGRYEVPEFAELAASLQLAGADGARVRASLAAKAKTLRTQHLAQLDAHAQSATERMSLPVVVLFAGFLVLIGYPALSLVLTSL
ncbi:type II secretion system F family protein [Salinactinospora qingdaonensis]|uniref:Type II secretion system protein GspF domain-containing protein n=1 Tax=Salinactinospora qingdaonensis TaxID=702744 RepID=A0ABP7FV10_9ACTN